MNILTYFLLIVEVITCLLLVGVILLQRTKGQGAGMAFGSGVGESLFGAQVGNVLTKTTVVLAIIFLVNTAILSLLSTRDRRKSVADDIKKTSPALSQTEVPVANQSRPVSLPETPGSVSGVAPPTVWPETTAGDVKPVIIDETESTATEPVTIPPLKTDEEEKPEE